MRETIGTPVLERAQTGKELIQTAVVVTPAETVSQRMNRLVAQYDSMITGPKRISVLSELLDLSTSTKMSFIVNNNGTNRL